MLKYTGTEVIKHSANSESRIRERCDLVVMLTSHLFASRTRRLVANLPRADPQKNEWAFGLESRPVDWEERRRMISNSRLVE